MITLDEVIATYGDPFHPTFERDRIISFPLPYALIYQTAMVTKSRAHRLAVPQFQAAFEAIKDADLMERASQYGGIYAMRSIRAFPGHLSAHAFACAVDINPDENALGTVGHMDPQIVEIFKRCGFSWGGEFHSRRDPMHFSLLGF